jgi:lysozyme
MHMSAQGRAFLRAEEGCRLQAYKDAAGVWTIGTGHTSAAGLPHVNPGMEITARQADEILVRDLIKFEEQVSRIVRVALAQCQFDALVSFTFNLGAGNLEHLVEASDLNKGDYAGVPRHLEEYTHAGGKVLADLVKRRAAEARIFKGAYPLAA